MVSASGPHHQRTLPNCQKKCGRCSRLSKLCLQLQFSQVLLWKAVAFTQTGLSQQGPPSPISLLSITQWHGKERLVASGRKQKVTEGNREANRGKIQPREKEANNLLWAGSSSSSHNSIVTLSGGREEAKAISGLVITWTIKRPKTEGSFSNVQGLSLQCSLLFCEDSVILKCLHARVEWGNGNYLFKWRVIFL